MTELRLVFEALALAALVIGSIGVLAAVVAAYGIVRLVWRFRDHLGIWTVRAILFLFFTGLLALIAGVVAL